jgi:hypothetical protein
MVAEYSCPILPLCSEVVEMIKGVSATAITGKMGVEYGADGTMPDALL